MDSQSWEKSMLGSRRRGFALSGLVVILAGATQAQDAVKPAVPKPEAVAEKPAEPAKTKPGPTYLNLRYDERYDYLDGEPDSYRKDFFDPIKNIRLNDDWRLTLGGDLRVRVESETNKAFGATEPAHDSFILHRYFLHADLRCRDVFRVFVQGVVAHDEDRRLAPRASDENHLDLHQFFFDVRLVSGDQPLTLRVGRQELAYGKDRLVTAGDWGNVRRRFDGVKLFSKGKVWDVDFWYVKPVVVQREQRDRFDEQYDFYGAYMTYKGIERHGLDMYAFASDDIGNTMNPNGRRGDKSMYTMGTRFWGKTAPWDYESDLAGQWGHWAGDSINAWSWSIDGGYTFAPVAWKPRLGAGFDWASGDKKPNDGRVQTFDQLFPLAHTYFGFIDLIGRQNITAVNANLSAWPIADKVRVASWYHAFWLTDDRDAMYGAAGNAVRRDRAGNSGKEIGHELDLIVSWKVDVHSSVLFGYAHFWDSDFIIRTGSSEDADLFYVSYAMKF